VELNELKQTHQFTGVINKIFTHLSKLNLALIYQSLKGDDLKYFSSEKAKELVRKNMLR